MDTYINILKKAFKITIAQKEWWVIAALAGLVHTGAIFNMLIKSFLHLQPAKEMSLNTIQQISPFFGWIISYARNVVLLETPHLITYISVSIIILLIIVITALIAQYILLFIVSKGTKEITWKTVFKKIHHIHILRLFSVNAIMRILFTIIVGLTIIVLGYFSTETLFTSTLSSLGIYSIALPLTLSVQIFGMFCLIQLVKKDINFGKMIHKTTNLLHKHWLSAFELALLLFIINFITSAILFMALICFAIIAGIIFEITLAMGSYIIMSIVTFVSLLVSAGIILVYAGFITTFNYSSWTILYERINRYSHLPAIETFFRKCLKK